MPTGYTDAIKDGIDFRTYAMNCARAFGACIELRDTDGGGDKIPEAFKPSDYNARRLVETHHRIVEVNGMSDEECEAAAAKDFQKSEGDRAASLEERSALRLKYEAMLAQVDAWEPPTPGHVEMKKFMRDQITQSIDFDCREWSYETQPRLSGSAWRAQTLAQLNEDAAYHERENAKEIERTNSRNAWIAALRSSLNREAVSA